MSSSAKYHLNKQDLNKIAVEACIALGGALLTNAAQIIPHIDFGSYTPVATAFLAILINTGWKWLDGIPENKGTTNVQPTTQTTAPTMPPVIPQNNP